MRDLLPPVVVLSLQLLALGSQLGDDGVVGRDSAFELRLPLVSDPLLLREHLVVVEGLRAVLLTPSLLSLVLLQLHGLHLGREVQHLLPEPIDLMLI